MLKLGFIIIIIYIRLVFKMKKDIKLLFGLKVREYRLKNGLRQCQLADLVNVDPKHISRIEAGGSFPSSELIGRLATALKVEPKDLFEFYHLQSEKDLKKDINLMLDKLSKENLSLVYKFVRTFIL